MSGFHLPAFSCVDRETVESNFYRTSDLLGTNSRFFRIVETAFSNVSGVMEPFSKYPAAPSWMSVFRFFSDRLVIIKTGMSAVDDVSFNLLSTSMPPISGMSMSRRIKAG